MKNAYDLVIVGAGPAGSAAAIRAAEAGLDVLLVEKRQEIGVPVRCGEATDIAMVRNFMPVEERWINNRISKYAIYNSEGECVVMPPSAETIIVDRKVFDAALAAWAARSGAEVRVRTTAVDLLREEGRICGVRLQSLGRSYDVRARIVIAADGTESQVARWAGLKTIPPLGDYFTGLQFTLAGLRGQITPEYAEYHLGMESLAPGGYIWVFPKSDDSANVGVVISANQAGEVSAQTRLEQFVAQHYPDASIISVVAGGIPVTGVIRRMVVDGLMVVGDAAHQADPLTAGGIGSGMEGAELAVAVAVNAIHSGDVSARVLQRYEALWEEKFGKMHAALHAVRKILTSMREEQLDSLIRTALRLPLETMSQADILMALLKHHPGLLLHVHTLITTGLVLK